VKYDGFRLLAGVDAGGVELKTRNGANATRWFPEISSSLADLRTGRHVLDGELCVLDEIGRSDFERLQARASMRGYRAGCDPVAYCVFDLLVLDGQDLRALPLHTRKAQLERLLRKRLPSVLRVTEVQGDEGTWLYQRMVELETEGIVSKRLDSVYLSGQRTGSNGGECRIPLAGRSERGTHLGVGPACPARRRFRRPSCFLLTRRQRGSAPRQPPLACAPG